MGSLDWNHVQRDIEEKLRQKPADDVKKKITIPDPVPAGNHLAHFIRSIHWNSKGMLPSTAGSQRTYDKYNTVTHLSFQGPDGFVIKPGEASGGFLRKKETVEDLMLSPRNQIFNRWKVPERMLESAPPGSKPFTPQEVEMPNIKIKTTPVPRVESRNGLQLTGSVGCKTPKSAERPMRPEPVVPQRSKTMFVETPRKKSSAENGIRLNSALLPEAVPQAEEWMKHADKADKKVIERILKMASKKHELEKSLKKSLLPDAKDSVEKWMKDANAEGQDKEKERQVALNFFNSLAGGQLMGMTVESQRKRLKEVLNTLEETKPGVPSYGRLKKNTRRRKETISDGKLRYVRLLTPDTRENRWMHTTWHHLPEYRDDNIVNNWSSHYIRPHEPTPRHFVIHPDWG
ncbi:uncharacterized protein LOC123554174 isoform X3 [Mercenaria mercenaria]|uniref:uncharacterized protein LOC123554174 isoform X3 n=1 Tax=Mercenaria mercenaria TaxID=6596 RepID=UPI001E1D92F4|nr:uncharacterized protein LOC123554174 isoform X3 [Mercenaria mercenaria]